MDFDLGGMLSGLFGGNASAPYQMPMADGGTMQIGGDQNPIMGWLSNNGGALAGAASGAGAQMMPKPQQIQPMQLNMPQQPQHAPMQVPQVQGMLNTPVAPPNPFGGR